MDTQSMPGLVDSKQPLLIERGVNKRFGAVEALVDVDVDLNVATFDRRSVAREDVVAAIVGAVAEEVAA